MQYLNTVLFISSYLSLHRRSQDQSLSCIPISNVAEQPRYPEQWSGRLSNETAGRCSWSITFKNSKMSSVGNIFCLQRIRQKVTHWQFLKLKLRKIENHYQERKFLAFNIFSPIFTCGLYFIVINWPVKIEVLHIPNTKSANLFASISQTLPFFLSQPILCTNSVPSHPALSVDTSPSPSLGHYH